MKKLTLTVQEVKQEGKSGINISLQTEDFSTIEVIGLLQTAALDFYNQNVTSIERSTEISPIKE